MQNKSENMELIFDELTESNKDIILLIAKSLEYTEQMMARQKCENSSNPLHDIHDIHKI